MVPCYPDLNCTKALMRTAAVLLLLSTLPAVCGAQGQSDCPPRTVINSGVCIGKNGRDCMAELQSPICNDLNPQYTDQAAKASVKGTVRLTATVGTDGCAHKIKVVNSLGFGLDDAAVFAMERWRFRKGAKAMPVTVEFDFDPSTSSRTPSTAPKCISLARKKTRP